MDCNTINVYKQVNAKPIDMLTPYQLSSMQGWTWEPIMCDKNKKGVDKSNHLLIPLQETCNN